MILGASNLAQRQLIPAALASGCFEYVEVASRRPLTLDNCNHIYPSYEKALTKSKADLVYVSLVNSEHATWVKRSLESGRHTIVDKPAFLTHNETVELTTLAVTNNLLLAEATVWTQHPQIDKLLSLFEKCSSTPSRAVALFSMPPFAPENFRWQKKLGGGALYDLGPYFASTGRLLFGSAAELVSANIHQWHNNEVPLSFSVQATWSGGGSLVGHFGFDTEYINRLEVLNSKMHIILNRAYTTPHDLKNTLTVSETNKSRSELCDAGNSFSQFFIRIVNDLKINSYQHWYQDMLDDSQSLRLLHQATKVGNS